MALTLLVFGKALEAIVHRWLKGEKSKTRSHDEVKHTERGKSDREP
jgi:hypothetical protein